MTAWHGGKGGNPRPHFIPRAELELRDSLWRAKEEDKPELLKLLEKMVEDRLAHEIYTKKTTGELNES